MKHCMFGSVCTCTHSSTPCAHDVVAECALVTVLCRRTVKVCMYVCVCVYIYMYYKLLVVGNNNNSLSAGWFFLLCSLGFW